LHYPLKVRGIDIGYSVEIVERNLIHSNSCELESAIIGKRDKCGGTYAYPIPASFQLVNPSHMRKLN
jgi:hypothetical protein